MNDAKIPQALAQVREWKAVAQREIEHMPLSEALGHIHTVARKTMEESSLSLPTLARKGPDISRGDAPS